MDNAHTRWGSFMLLAKKEQIWESKIQETGPMDPFFHTSLVLLSPHMDVKLLLIGPSGRDSKRIVSFEPSCSEIGIFLFHSLF